ncbi:RICIN domain-containing protein [Prevotella sp. E2-28]|uniref:transglutaminase domain-containing protein n=1 Tax=Prevotella sp. E2-28 TaxID=2913620 RepID=UPI001EDA9EA7|nr:RICIN domain-containing protein [Prevotella sp. E2-28]UKK53723.1 RICIN domain-containing protein [Prevotella sp. E2-28]
MEYFEDDPDPLKYEAARFLIENMPSQYCMSGSAVDMIDSIFISASMESQNVRTKFFNDSTSKINTTQAEMSYDISEMKADYLIKVINDACDMWNASTWYDDYDRSLFFEYVLPYRLCHEPPSDWRASVKNAFPLLDKDIVMSRRGIQLEAEDAQTSDCDTKEYGGASNGKAKMMYRGKSSITYTIESERQTQKRLILRYSSTAHHLTAVVTVNDIVVDTLHLAPTRNIESFSDKWFNKAMPIRKGKNRICIMGVSDTVCVDYIQLGALEVFSHKNFEDFSSTYYNIVNKASGHCVSFDTTAISTNNIVRLKPYSSADNTQLVRLDYSGYPLWRIGYHKKDSTDFCLQMEFGTPRTLCSETPVTIGEYVKKPFDQWLFMPLGGDDYRIMNKHTGLFLDTKKDSVNGDWILVQNKYSDFDSQKWELRKQGVNPYSDRCFRFHSAMSEAMRVFDLTHQFEYYIYGSPFGTNAGSLFKAKSGKCADETSFSVFLCRYLGIPSAYDFTPHWGNRSSSHSWSVLIDEHGKGIPFYMGNFPGDTAHYFHSYIKPKVFRYRYSLNKQIKKDLKREKSVPKLFENPHYTDVTEEYCKTVDVKRQVPEKYENRDVAYICVFDNRNWVPIHYGIIRDGSATFKAMGCGIVYMAGFYEDGEIVPFGNPFLINKDGKITDIIPSKKMPIKMTLLRKYPFMGAQDYFNSRMNGGQFQASNKQDFSDSVVLHTHKGITNGNWYNIPVSSEQKFKYLRYMGGKGSHCNINELEFYDPEGKKIEGKIIGTEGEGWARKENVFDGNILTGFGGISPDGNWVGLQLEKPTFVSRIKYIGRNDGNCVEMGDTYELYYWSANGDWELLGSKKATSNYLQFTNIPSGGLYILKDVTKGVEERIFTYENGKQIWW